MWDPFGPGIKLMSPALAGRFGFFTTEPPGKPLFLFNFFPYTFPTVLMYITGQLAYFPSLAVYLFLFSDLSFTLYPLPEYRTFFLLKFQSLSCSNSNTFISILRIICFLRQLLIFVSSPPCQIIDPLKTQIIVY